MRIVYYYSANLQTSPAKQFLLKYDLKSNNTEKQKNHKIKTLTFIDQAILFIAENKAKPIPPIAKTIKGYKFHEIRVKDGGSLIRIFYFCYHKEQLVLLNAFEKPDLYEKGLKKKIDKKIIKILEQTKEYYQDFINNQNYEDYK